MGRTLKAFVSTSYVEKHNQTMRQHMRRFTRLTSGHSKKIDNRVLIEEWETGNASDTQ
jgi:hypothetical protein